MVAKVFTSVAVGCVSELVTVEVDISNGLPATIMVGLPDTVVEESRERVRTAIRQSQFSYPQTRVSINLSPAHLSKRGTHFDLAIAVGVLLASGVFQADVSKTLFLGELSLDGEINAVGGALALAQYAQAQGINEIIVGIGNQDELSLLDGVNIYTAKNLPEVIRHLRGDMRLATIQPMLWSDSIPPSGFLVDFADIVGQALPKRAAEIAAAGFHNIRFVGPPGSGKTLLVQALSGILPPVSRNESILLTTIAGLAAGCKVDIVRHRPVRQPHHTMSTTALVGGGANPRPGEVTQAHGGILFLDELPEFTRSALESLRQPLESGEVVVARAKATVTYPAKFMLVAAQNPCPCGYSGDPTIPCRCDPGAKARYIQKVSGPLLDRIDLHVSVPRLSYGELRHNQIADNSSVISARVQQAQRRQATRLGVGRFNSAMRHTEVKRFCQLSAEAEHFLEQVVNKYHLSGRGVHRLLKVSRTIADLAEVDQIKTSHLAEAVQYRFF